MRKAVIREKMIAVLQDFIERLFYFSPSSNGGRALTESVAREHTC
jgi:hypothetical protein